VVPSSNYWQLPNDSTFFIDRYCNYTWNTGPGFNAIFYKDISELMRNIKTLIIIVILSFPIFGEELFLNPPKYSVMKSALLPGWGEHGYDSQSRGYLFNGIEASLWVFAGLAYSSAHSSENDLFYFAAEYGQITNPQSKSDIFLDRVSKYDSMEEYNEQMLRNRQWDRIYSEENGEYWEWDTPEKRIEYFNIKTQRYQWRQKLTYTFGAIALNHLVSAMDVLYLKRQHVSASILPEVGSNSAGMRLSLSF